MPESPPRICPTCKSRVKGRCQTCEKQRQREVNSRRKVDKKFYDSKQWGRIRAKQLADFPFCQWLMDDGRICGKLAKHVDHKIAREKKGSDSQDNLQSLCVSHHSTKTVLYDGGFGNRTKSG
jgi:5-methylcytosine-specific restriction protein A